APEPFVYVACTEPDLRDAVFTTTLALRREGIRCDADYQGKSLKGQLKQAGRSGARACVLLGPDEMAAGTATIRDMDTHEQVSVPAGELAARVRDLLS
ncbi:MAG: His/Gly/Thr/Pro-type tRNA ligase C-terminal domain-containing protein, partial [Atopobiaceae bacterium]|nr:His/Gly/Thr/Pro-type tRNA ligase C-terminal domain-containing protein [Atopobiaceae bacterium]